MVCSVYNAGVCGSVLYVHILYMRVCCTSLPVDLGGGLLMKLSVCSSQSSKGLETHPLEACSEKKINTTTT